MITVNVKLSKALGRDVTLPIASKVRKVSRTKFGKFVANHIRDRIQTKGAGAGGKRLKGYSSNPVKVSRGLLKKRVPSDGLPKFYDGGYAEYREDVGLQIDHFDFTNTGASFRGFQEDVGDAQGSTPILIGFKNAKSHKAAMSAVARGRSSMFDLSNKELDAACAVYLNSVVAQLWDDVFEGAPNKQKEKA
jgi:hypothetical protein